MKTEDKNLEKLLFLSHHSLSTKDMVMQLATILEKDYKVPCWYAERDIAGSQNYTKTIPSVLSKQTKGMLLLLNEEAQFSDQILREVQMALELKLPILVIKLDDTPLSDTYKYICSTMQVIPIFESNEAIAIQNIISVTMPWLGKEWTPKTNEGFVSSRGKNMFDFYGDEGERERLTQQRKFVYGFARDVYQRVLSELTDGTFLDVGCNTGEQTKMFLESTSNITNYVGIDKEDEALQHGKLVFPDGRFYKVDCESEDLDDELYRIEDELGIEGFDVINVSMVLLHLSEPETMLDVLCDHLNEDGTLIILDIDDGLNIAYPDPDNLFQKAIDLCFETKYSGFRHSGRQIFTMLKACQLKHIVLERAGLSTVGMDRTEKSVFFDLYFWFVLDDLRKMHEEYPDNEMIASRLEWMEQNYRKMRANFKGSNFFFNLGFMLFTAKKDDL